MSIYLKGQTAAKDIATASRNVLIGTVVMKIAQWVYDSFSGVYFCSHQRYFNEKRLKDEIILDLVINYRN